MFVVDADPIPALKHYIATSKQLHTAFKPWPLLNGHLHTILTVLTSAFSAPTIHYDRHLLQLDDKGTISLDFASSPSHSSSSPIVVILHGLSGGSHEAYVRLTLSRLLETSASLGVVINARGCGNTALTSPIMFNARITSDVRAALGYISTHHPNRPLFLIGFSLGANILINYLADHHSDFPAPIIGAVSVSNPWDLVQVNTHLMSTLLLRTYARVMGTGLRQLFKKHMSLLQLNPKIDTSSVLQSTYLIDYDAAVTAPCFNYTSTTEYYTDASCAQRLPGANSARIPILALNALDDPIACAAALPTTSLYPSMLLVTTPSGGHIGWFGRHGRWFVDMIQDYYNIISSA